MTIMFVRLFCSVLLLLPFVAGCSRPAEQQGEVSGKVTYRGKPLPGGRITFVGAKGYTGAAVISLQGEYHLKAPLGEVHIGVFNQMLNKNNPDSQKMASFIRGKKEFMKQRAKSDEKSQPATANEEVIGTYVKIPARYADPTTSGLTYTVQSGSQTHDVELAD
jgi:hypothetical protein